MPCRKVVVSLSFFRFMANFEQSGRINSNIFINSNILSYKNWKQN